MVLVLYFKVTINLRKIDQWSVHLPCLPANRASRRRATLESSQSIGSSRTSSPSASVSTESGIVTIGFDDGLASVTSFTYPPDTPFSVSSKSLEVRVK
ncbi:Hypothetical predicted protein [Cloeon dipterum]|uniref:Uncharacterized protein n=1 Tax=Cloeon dipterum TaxID=197152 RepID=A0A8S1E4J6_9INSE|nr:Hypothetical predicted protein [Cloeon dipterum]